MQPKQYGPAIDGGVANYYLRRAMGFMHISDPRDMGFFFDDLLEGEALWPQEDLSTSGVIRPVNNRVPGWLEFDTGATAGSAPTLTRATGSGAIQQGGIPGGTSGVWYFAMRVAVNQAVSTTQTDLALRMAASNSLTTDRGRLGKLNGQANYGFKADGGAGAFINSGIAIDTTARVLEVYRYASLTYLFVDGAPLGTPSDTFPSTTAVPQLYGTNGTDAVSRSMLVDWVSVGMKVRSTS